MLINTRRATLDDDDDDDDDDDTATLKQKFADLSITN